MSRTRLAGILLFLFVPTVLVLYLRMPFGLAPSVLSGIAIMLLHRRVARPFMDRHLSERCYWCGCDLSGPGVAAPFRAGRETIAARTCDQGHAAALVTFARSVAASRWILGTLILIPVAAYLGNAFLAMAGRAPLSFDAARWIFKVPIAVAVVGLSLGWPLGLSSDREPAIDFPAHNLSLLGVSWTLWVFRVVGLVWLVQAMWAALRLR